MSKQIESSKLESFQCVCDSIKTLIEAVRNLSQQVERNRVAIEVMAKAIDSRSPIIFEDCVVRQIQNVYNSNGSSS